MISHDPIWENGDFYQTNLLRKQLIEKKETIKNILSEENYAILEKHIAHIQKVFDSVLNIFKKTYGNGEFYFTYGEAQKFTDRKEFIDIFKNKVVFFSNSNKQFPTIGNALMTPKATQELRTIPNIDNVIAHIKTQKETNKAYGCFIFSPRKEESKKIFEDLCKNNIHTQSEILVENITGGIGKNIFKAKQSKNKILI